MPKVKKSRFKYTYSFIKEHITDQGFFLLTPESEYKNVATKLLLRCPKGHEYTTNWSNFYKKGHRCKSCRKIGIDKVRESFEKEGYTLLSKKYNNQYTKLEYICNRGHQNVTSWNVFKTGCRCPECVKTSFLDIVKEFEKWDYKVLSKKEDYTHNRYKFKFICPEGHEDSMTWGNFKHGFRCGQCAFNRKKTYEEVKKVFEDRGYTLLSKDYKHSKAKLKFICPKGHRHSISYTNFVIHNQDCGLCSPTRPKTLEEIQEHLESINWVLLADEYVNCETRFKCQCPKGHVVEKTWDTFKMGQGCPSCSHIVSKAELEIGEYLESFGVEIIRNSRSIIPPYEIDIFIPAAKVALEYCGLYWHSEIGGGKNRRYHREKYDRCLQEGIRLITIFEDEYLDRPEVVLSRIGHAVGITEKTIYARKCKVFRIENSEANAFYDSFHLQGKTRSKYSWGLFHNKELISCLSLGSLSRRHVKGDKNIVELKRMSSLPGFNIVGGFGKLFSAAKIESYQNKIQGIKSYCDMRYGNPFKTIYDVLGFKLAAETKYTPHYVKGEKRFRNQSLAKTKEERKTGLTEWELRQDQGYDRIWDCGHRTYLYEI